ncbi:hypothetical protein BDY24DRAFT_398695 [Mrakia frigida]|uniref:uncharacterized protein n=1 Tax=Mrakia frigida TaxID=29902 RepID=UPI003FCBF194
MVWAGGGVRLRSGNRREGAGGVVLGIVPSFDVRSLATRFLRRRLCAVGDRGRRPSATTRSLVL